jgi:hypothetical protein
MCDLFFVVVGRRVNSVYVILGVQVKKLWNDVLDSPVPKEPVTETCKNRKPSSQKLSLYRKAT